MLEKQRRIEYTVQFKRDFKQAEKRRKNLPKLKMVMEMLINRDEIPERYRDHPLRGDWVGSRDIHVEPNWLLLYTILENGELIRFERMGTHSDLFR